MLFQDDGGGGGGEGGEGAGNRGPRCDTGPTRPPWTSPAGWPWA